MKLKSNTYYWVKEVKKHYENQLGHPYISWRETEELTIAQYESDNTWSICGSDEIFYTFNRKKIDNSESLYILPFKEVKLLKVK